MDKEMRERYEALRRHCAIALEHLPQWARESARVTDWRYTRHGEINWVEAIVDFPLGVIVYIWQPDSKEYTATCFVTGKEAKFAKFDEAVRFAGGRDEAA